MTSKHDIADATRGTIDYPFTIDEDAEIIRAEIARIERRLAGVPEDFADVIAEAADLEHLRSQLATLEGTR